MQLTSITILFKKNMAESNSDREYFLRLLRSCILGCIVDLEGSPDRDFSSFRIDSLYHTTLRFAEVFELDESVIQLISNAKDMVDRAMNASFSLSCPQLFSGAPGRPKYEIKEDILRFLFDKRFTVKNAATLLGVSKRTIERRMNEFGLQISNCYSDISNSDLESIVRNLTDEFPNVGYKRMSGLLLARGLRIQQERIRETMRRVDPQGTLFRALSLRAVHRRRYHVPSAQSLWHVDGNHKLIR
jgi:hypothetical protein